MSNKDNTQHPSTIFIYIIYSVVFIYVAYLFFGIGNKTVIECYKTPDSNGECKIINKSLIKTDEQSFKINDINKMIVSLEENSDDYFLKFVLDTKESDKLELKTLNKFGVDIPGSRYKLADEFNNFLHNNEEAMFKKEFDNRKLPYICGGLLLLLVVWGAVHIFIKFGKLLMNITK